MANNIRFASIGLGHIVQTNRVIAVISPGTKSATQFLSRGRKTGMYIDASRGRKFRSIVVMDDGTVISSAISVMTLLQRFMDDSYSNVKNGEDIDFMFEDEEGTDAEDEEDS